MNNIIFIGFMGSGKSTVGKEIAGRLNIGFLDMDEVIESQTGMSVTDIFATRGEQYFRDLETDFLKNFSKNKYVISTGGGVVLRPENVTLLKKMGHVVFLHATPEHIMKNLKDDHSRPLLQGEDPQEKIRQLLEQRDGIYLNSADVIIQTSGKSVNEIVDEVLSLIAIS